MKLSIANKLSIGATLLVIISVGVTSWLFYSKTTEILVNEAIENIAKQMRVTGESLKTRIDTQNKDILFLAGTPPIQGILRAMSSRDNYDTLGKSSYSEWKQRLEDIFMTMLGTKPSYLKIRLINKDGKEIAVAGRSGKALAVVDDDKLQDKSKRNYVRQTLKLPSGSVYLSEINLNKEYGKISIPHQEVLRSATPIYDERNGSIAGLVVVTVDIGQVLHNIQRVIHDAGKEVFITNDRGGYLLHTNSNKAYGFDLGKRFRVQEDIPEIAEQYLPDNNVEQSILLLDNDSQQVVVNFTKLYFDTAKPERFIAVGITELYSQILHEQEKLLDNVVVVIAALAIIAVFLAIFFAYKLSKPIKQITQVMNDYVQGITSAETMPVESDDEIGVLARSYQTLMDQVKEAQLGLTNMNKGLESRVIERTRKLEQSERRQRSIVDNMADGLITMDDQGIVISFNRAATNIFGYAADEVIGNNIKMLMPSPYRDKHDDYLRAYKRTRAAKVIGVSSEVEGIRKDGTVFALELAVSEMLIDNKNIYTGVLRDITERKQVERLKNEFVSTVSHELRTPLTSIRGSLGLISGGALGEVSANIKDMLVVAENNAQRLLLLINDILDMQKIEVGEISFHFDEVELSSLIEESIKENEMFADEYAVNLVFERHLEDVYVYADRDRLKQVIVNLLSNAVKFSPPASVVGVVLSRSDKSLCISVSDSGPGIPEDFQPKLFEKFTQSDSSATRAKGGTGLGLTISKAIIERHNGSLQYSTSTSTGTVFTVELLEIVPDASHKSVDTA